METRNVTPAHIKLRYHAAINFARKARLLLKMEATDIKIKAGGSLVTYVDNKIDEDFRKILEISDFKNDKIISEEGEKIFNGGGTWIVDSLDGTANFVNKNLYHAISIGYFEGNEPLFGVVVLPDPRKGGFSIVSACKGEGILLRMRKLEKPIEPPKPMGAIDFVQSKNDPLIYLFPELSRYVGSLNPERTPLGEMRVIGSIACGLAEVALGRLSFYIHSRPRIWDVAAGISLLREAGKDINIKEFDLAKIAPKDFRLPVFIAAQNENILSEVKEIVSHVGLT
ncbi:MAG: hypothetical protein NT030_05465 [Candidatus Saganbacteria bacterium]|nr:hypothetical protein [Candidatus Saganbacteria bacterium]